MAGGGCGVSAPSPTVDEQIPSTSSDSERIAMRPPVHDAAMSGAATGGLLRTETLRQRGWTKGAIERAVEAGELWRVVRGWYAEPGTDAELIRAVRLGARLGCVSALRTYGAWHPPDAGLHVAMPYSADGRRLRSADPDAWASVTVHWRSKTDRQEWRTGASPVLTAAAHAVECQPPHFAVAVLDSLIHRGLASTRSLFAMLAVMPAHHRELATALDGRSEEGIESVTRFRLHQAGIRAEPQVVVPGVGRVDLLIDGWLALELDGRQTHAQQASFSSDRRRHALLLQRGKSTLHFSYSHVIYEWPLVLETVRSALRQH
jgi:very-short-patch-repair endonuclease